MEKSFLNCLASFVKKWTLGRVWGLAVRAGVSGFGGVRALEFRVYGGHFLPQVGGGGFWLGLSREARNGWNGIQGLALGMVHGLL